MPDHATFCWNELVTNDVDGAKKFYKAVLGWTVEDMPMPGGAKYGVVKVNGKPACGIMDVKDTGMHEEGEGEGGEDAGGDSHWVAYVHVDDVDKAVAKVEASGGGVIKPPFDIQGVGRIALVEDSTGAIIGLMTSKS